MKRILFFLMFGAAVTSCKDRKTDKSANTMEAGGKAVHTDSTAVNLIDPEYDFGKVTEGEKVVFSYRFVNMGPNKLIIDRASPSCGCTVAEIPKEPIAVGDTGYIKIEFDSKGKSGDQHKTITVESNAYPAIPSLLLKGQIVAAK